MFDNFAVKNGDMQSQFRYRLSEMVLIEYSYLRKLHFYDLLSYSQTDDPLAETDSPVSPCIGV